MLTGIALIGFGLYLLAHSRFELQIPRYIPSRFTPHGTYILRSTNLKRIGCAYSFFGGLILVGILSWFTGWLIALVLLMIILTVAEVVPDIQQRTTSRTPKSVWDLAIEPRNVTLQASTIAGLLPLTTAEVAILQLLNEQTDQYDRRWRSLTPARRARYDQLIARGLVREFVADADDQMIGFAITPAGSRALSDYRAFY